MTAAAPEVHAPAGGPHEASGIDPWAMLSAAGTVLALTMPVAAWAELDSPPVAVGMLLFWLLVPGVAVVPAVFGRFAGALWAALVVPVSLALAMLIVTAQSLVRLDQPAASMSLLALLHVLAVPRARLELAARQRVIAPRFSRRTAATALGALAVSLLLWWWSTRIVDLDALGPAGIVTVMPLVGWCGVAVAAAVLAVAIGRGPGVGDARLAALAVAVLVIELFTFLGVADGSPPVPTTYVHLGIIDAIQELGRPAEGVDARFSWPGFFLVARAIFETTGVDDPLPALVLYPAAAVLLLLPGVHVLGRAVGGSARSGWFAVVVFVGGLWVQQDYFSPQSVAMLSLVGVVATLVWLTDQVPDPAPARRWWSPQRARLTPARVPGWGARRAVAVELVLVVLLAGLAIGHQLTPLAVVLIAVGFALTGLTRLRTLWLVGGTLVAVWFAFGAADWWTGSLGALLGEVGDVGGSVNRALVDRSGAADPVYSLMQRGRIAWSAAIALVAFVAAVRLRRSPAARAAAISVAAPAVLVVGQSYGGEIALRVYLYALPGLAALAGVAVAWWVDRSERRELWRVGAVLVVAVVGLTTARGVNASFERVPPDVVEAADELLATVPDRTTFTPMRTTGVLQQRRLARIDEVAPVPCETTVSCVLGADPDYVFVTTMQEAVDRWRTGIPAGAYTVDLVNALEISGAYRVVHRTDHVIVLRTTDPTRQESPR